ncbi:hypothetical protein GCM10022225_74080 [Plantactinospora mayteni]|uniref:Secreted protein n=1 Tax=Plantactinospora mayteni TaxID=566021 RepID=A0ABQ4EWC2_9ACTN|nr:hypothetical protein Pma05_55070 [Plantactinospora mayteni]
MAKLGLRLASVLVMFGMASATLGMAPATASGTERLAGATSPNQLVVVAGQDGTVTYYSKDGVKRGMASFHSYGEAIYACDLRADGIVVSAKLQWFAGSTGYTSNARDSNGAQPGCGTDDNSIAEGTPATLTVCAGTLGCSSVRVVA